MNNAKFKPGDKIVVSNPTFYWKNCYKNKVYTIKSIDPNDVNCYGLFDQYKCKPTHHYGVEEKECMYILFEDEIEGVNEEMFTKKDLQDGDVVLFKNDDVGIFIKNTETFVTKDGYLNLSSYDDDLTVNSFFDLYTIKAVRRPRPDAKWDCQFSAFKCKYGKLVFERKDYEEMTVADIEKALGKKIKIVKEK